MSGATGEDLRVVEALLFAAAEPLTGEAVAQRLPEGSDVAALLAELQAHYAGRGVNLVCVDGRWALRTAPDLAPLLKLQREVARKLSQAAAETLAIVAYHQPVTRPEVEAIRGVSASKGTFDVLLELGWIRPGRRRDAPGRPLTWITTQAFLDHFGLAGVEDLPGMKDLEAAGLLDTRPAIDVLGDRPRELPEPASEDETPDEPLETEPAEAAPPAATPEDGPAELAAAPAGER